MNQVNSQVDYIDRLINPICHKLSADGFDQLYDINTIIDGESIKTFSCFLIPNHMVLPAHITECIVHIPHIEDRRMLLKRIFQESICLDMTADDLFHSERYEYDSINTIIGTCHKMSIDASPLRFAAEYLRLNLVPYIQYLIMLIEKAE